MLTLKAKPMSLKTPSLPFLITTPNLVLRPLLNEDMHIITKIIDINLPALKMWLPWLDEGMQNINAQQLTEHLYKESKEHKAEHMVVYNNQDFIGMASLFDLSDNGFTAKLGYWFNTSTDKCMINIFTEALRATTQIAFSEWKVLTLTIPCVAGNFFSEMAAKELKFKIKRIDLVSGKSIKIYELNSFEFINTIEMTVVPSPDGDSL